MFLITLFDVGLIIATIVGVAYLASLQIPVRFARLRQTTGFTGQMWGPVFIAVGLGLICLFYLTELFVIHGLPLLAGEPTTSTAAQALRLNYRWLFNLVAYASLLAGFILSSNRIVAVINQLDIAHTRLFDSEHHLQQLNDDLEDRVSARTAELAATNQALEDSQWILESTMDAVPLGILIRYSDGSIYVNQEARNITEDVVEPNLEELSKLEITAAGIPMDPLPGSRSLSGELVHYNCVEVKTRSGNYFQAEVWSSPVYDSHGNIRCAVTAILDIRKRKRLENELKSLNSLLEERVQKRTRELTTANEALLASEKKLRVVIEALPFAVVLSNPDGKLEYLNSKTEKLWGEPIARGEVYEKMKGRVSFGDSTRQIGRREIPEVRALTGESVHYPYMELINPQGNTIPIEIWSSPVLDPDGNIIAAVTVILDITETKNAERELHKLNLELEERVQQRTQALNQAIEDLQESQRTVEAVIEAMPIGVLIRYADGPTYMNRSILEIGDRQQLSGEADYRERIRNNLRQKGTDGPFPFELLATSRVFQGEKNVHVTDMELLRVDGTWAPIENWAQPIFDRHGNIKAAVSAVVDMTEHEGALGKLIEARQEAEFANKTKSSFLANMSHEIRTPMNAILGYAQILSREAHLSDQHQEHLATIMRRGEHLLTLINDILDLSKIEAGHIELNEVELDTKLLLQNIESKFMHRAREKTLDFKVEVHPDVPRTILIDDGKLHHTIVNLVDNAIKFTYTGHVTVSCAVGRTEEHSFLTVEVEDTGPGIGIEDREKLFEPFKQLSANYEGTGLGLAISSMYAEFLGGELQVESEPGKGSRFCLSVPFRHTTQAAANDNKQQRVKQAGEAATDLELRASMISGLSADQIPTLKDAITAGDLETFLAIINGMEKLDTAVASALGQLAKEFRYEQILGLLNAIDQREETRSDSTHEDTGK